MKSARPEASPLRRDVLEPSGDSARSPDGLREHEELGEGGAGGVSGERDVDGVGASVDDDAGAAE